VAIREVVLDTETTGLDPADGHRIIEIGCVEVLNRRRTGKHFHVYLNPEREVDAGAVDVHGLTDAFLADKPLFSEICDEFLAFVDGARLVIHNAPFDIGFLDHELRLLGGTRTSMESQCEVLDTLAMARRMHPGQRASLDALCKRYEISNAHREFHGALLDAELLGDVYLAMTTGQSMLMLETAGAAKVDGRASAADAADARPAGQPLVVFAADEGELREHEAYLDHLDKVCGAPCVWRQGGGTAQ
jgi:DNA polymerase-3 subunit epsilon